MPKVMAAFATMNVKQNLTTIKKKKMKDLDLIMLLDEFKADLETTQQNELEGCNSGNLVKQSFNAGGSFITERHIKLLTMVIESRKISRKVNDLLTD